MDNWCVRRPSEDDSAAMSRPLTFFLALLLVGCPTEGDDDDTTSALIDDDDDDDDDDDSVGDDDTSSPEPVGDWVAIGCGASSLCAIDQAGRPFCVYSPNATSRSSLSPEPIVGLVEVVPYSAGGCGLDASGQLTCWGASLEEVRIADPLFSLSHGAAIRQSDQQIVSWGSNYILTNLNRTWEQLNHDGSNLGCGRTATRIECMDTIYFGGAILPGAYVDLAGNGRQVCGLDSSGVITCAEDEDAPTCVPGTKTWQPIAPMTGWTSRAWHRRSAHATRPTKTFASTPATVRTRQRCPCLP